MSVYHSTPVRVRSLRAKRSRNFFWKTFLENISSRRSEMYQGTESLILDQVRRLGSVIDEEKFARVHAYVMEPGRHNDYRGSVTIEMHPMHYEDGPASVTARSSQGDTLRILRFLSENPEVVRNAVKAAMSELEG
jgi:hypothetical protein